MDISEKLRRRSYELNTYSKVVHDHADYAQATWLSEIATELMDISRRLENSQERERTE